MAQFHWVLVVQIRIQHELPLLALPVQNLPANPDRHIAILPPHMKRRQPHIKRRLPPFYC